MVGGGVGSLLNLAIASPQLHLRLALGLWPGWLLDVEPLVVERVMRSYSALHVVHQALLDEVYDVLVYREVLEQVPDWLAALF